jgi:tetratricopeptide (TPR) repeat protein
LSERGPSESDLDDIAGSAMAALEQGNLEDGERLARQALRAADRIPPGPDRHRARARGLRSLGSAQRARGQYRDAEATFERALPHALQGFGRATVEVAELHNDLGMTFKYAGRFAEAEAAYEQARSILETLPRADPDDLAALLHNLAGLAHARGDFAAADPLARRGIAIRSAALGPRAPETLLDRSAHAAILAGLGESVEAEATIRDLLPDLEAALGPDHPEVAVALNNLAAIVQGRGDLPEAESLYRRVIEIRTTRLGADSPTLAVPLNNLGTVLRSAGRPAEAAIELRRALHLLEGAVAGDHPNLRAIRRNLARVPPDVS